MKLKIFLILLIFILSCMTGEYAIGDEFNSPLFSGGEVDVLSRYGGGVNSTDSAIEAALSDIGKEKAVLILRGTWTISRDRDWSQYTNVTFKIMRECILSHGTYTLKIPNPDAGLYRWLSGKGTVIFSGSVKEVYPEWWGGGPNASASDNAKALNAAFATLMPIFCSAGTWNFNSNLTLTNVPSLRGVSGKTIFKPSAVVSGAFITVNTTIRSDIAYNHQSTVRDIAIDGSATTSVTGLKIGTNAPAISNQIFLDNIEISGFKIGLYIVTVVHFEANRCMFAKNGTGCLINPPAIGTTTMSFKKTYFAYSSTALNDGIGLKIVQGFNVIIDDCIFENNSKEGLKIVIGANQRANVSVANSWFEDNQKSERTPHNYYHIAVDGAGRGSIGSISFRLRDTNFALAPDSPKAISVIRVDHFDIGDIFVGSGAPASIFNFANHSYGKIKIPYVWGDPSRLIANDATNVIDVSENLFFIVIASETAAPNVTGGVNFLTSNRVPTTITNFIKGSTGQRINVYFRDGNTTIKFSGGGHLKGNGGADWRPAYGAWMECNYEGTDSAGTNANWYCVTHTAS
jgi:hypothetical protein